MAFPFARRRIAGRSPESGLRDRNRLLEVLRESFADHALLETIITGVKRLPGGATGSHG
jgi:hypothetical protein